MGIECLVLGAGQEVGKSCVVVNINGKKIMFDCGMHMGYHDHRRYPDFSLISKSGDFDQSLTCIIITHFHLDHVGALPYFTEVCGYRGPIYMTYPTKALAPLMLEDYRKVMVDRMGGKEQFTADQIVACMEKVIPVDLKQTVQVDEDLEIRAYYAGHVLGAAMFYASVGDAKIVYTGDYNMTPDRHLGAAQIDRLQLDLLITESTYATTVRDSKYAREKEFLKAVHKCIASGGKVLIPTFALGRAQELCILLEDYWERMNLKVPIYFSAGLTIQANMYSKMLISWTSQKVKEAFTTRNAFDFKHVRSFDRAMINDSGPCVLFATPGMINGGFSLEVFKHWAPSEKNLITLPGYCVAGTIGHKLMSGKPTKIDLDKETQIDVRCQVSACPTFLYSIFVSILFVFLIGFVSGGDMWCHFIMLCRSVLICQLCLCNLTFVQDQWVWRYFSGLGLFSQLEIPKFPNYFDYLEADVLDLQMILFRSRAHIIDFLDLKF